MNSILPMPFIRTKELLKMCFRLKTLGVEEHGET